MDRELVASLGTALAVGLLIGLERQRAITRREGKETIGGVRTFPLIALVGAVATLLAPVLGTWIVPAALLGLALRCSSWSSPWSCCRSCPIGALDCHQPAAHRPDPVRRRRQLRRLRRQPPVAFAPPVAPGAWQKPPPT